MIFNRVNFQDSCELCDNSGIQSIAEDGIPVTCTCPTGKNALAANPTWYEAGT